MPRSTILDKTFLNFSFHVLAQLFFTTSETKLDYYHQKVNLRVASWVTERVKSKDLRKCINFNKIPGMLILDSNHPAGQALTPTPENSRIFGSLTKLSSAKILHRLLICSVNAKFIVNGDTFWAFYTCFFYWKYNVTIIYWCLKKREIFQD